MIPPQNCLSTGNSRFSLFPFNSSREHIPTFMVYFSFLNIAAITTFWFRTSEIYDVTSHPISRILAKQIFWNFHFSCVDNLEKFQIEQKHCIVHCNKKHGNVGENWNMLLENVKIWSQILPVKKRTDMRCMRTCYFLKTKSIYYYYTVFWGFEFEFSCTQSVYTILKIPNFSGI